MAVRWAACATAARAVGGPSRRARAAAVVAAPCRASAAAITPFVVKDIRVEGVQRTEAGTVFSYLPIKVGDTIDDEKAAAAVKALFATGFFRDVRLEVQDGVLIVIVQERPTISKIDIIGQQGIRHRHAEEGAEGHRRSPRRASSTARRSIAPSRK